MNNNLQTKGTVLISIKYNQESDYLEKIQLICEAFGKVHINLKDSETVVTSQFITVEQIHGIIPNFKNENFLKKHVLSSSTELELPIKADSNLLLAVQMMISNVYSEGKNEKKMSSGLFECLLDRLLHMQEMSAS